MATYNFAENFKNLYDYNQCFSLMRRTVETNTAALQIMVEGVQAIARRNAEALRDNTDQVLKASRETFQGGSPDVNLGRQVEVARTILENNLNTLREVTKTLTESSFEALDVINKRATENMEEFSRAAQPVANAAARATRKSA